MKTATTKTLPVACMANPLTDTMLSQYSSMISGLESGELKDALRSLYDCVNAWWNIDESKEQPTKWPMFNVATGKRDHLLEVPFSDDIIKKLDLTTPWISELNRLSNAEATGLFDSLTGELRDMAFHLLWYAKEISLDREPITQDKHIRG